MFRWLNAKNESELRGKLLAEPWARIALAIGLDPVDIEGQGRDILRRIAASGVDVTATEKTDVQ